MDEQMTAPGARAEVEKPHRRKRRRLVRFWKRNRKSVLFWAGLFLIVVVGWRLKLDKHILAPLAIIWGLATQIFAVAFAYLVAAVGAVPFLGPFMVKIITVPLFLLINGLAFFASLVGVKIGHKRRVFESRIAATIFMIGLLVGYIIGKIF